MFKLTSFPYLSNFHKAFIFGFASHVGAYVLVIAIILTGVEMQALGSFIKVHPLVSVVALLLFAHLLLSLGSHLYTKYLRVFVRREGFNENSFVNALFVLVPITCIAAHAVGIPLVLLFVFMFK